MAENITRCPKCNTSFRISEKHLNSGKGAVRCGSCLNVFIARDFLTEAKTLADESEQNTDTSFADTPAAGVPATPSSPHDEPATVGKKPKKSAESNSLLISDDMDSEEDSKVADDDSMADDNTMFSRDSHVREYEFNLFERGSSYEEEEEVTPQDESWALDLLANDEEETYDTPTTEELAQEEEQQITQEFDDSYYKNSFKIIDEVDSSSEKSDKSGLGSDRNDHIEYDQNHYDEPDIEEFDYSELSERVYETSNSSGRYLDSIEPEPVEFDWQQGSNLWHSKALWAGLSLFSGLCLTAQVAWIKFDSLSMIEPYRAYYAQACSILGCELPPLVNRAKIRTANLVVRTHPNVKGALIVDAVLQNTAKFQQKYPVLDLVFTNSQDKVVAAKRLIPSDYLGGELAGKTYMPINQPVHIAIELADPGSHATGYKMTIAR